MMDQKRRSRKRGIKKESKELTHKKRLTGSVAEDISNESKYLRRAALRPLVVCWGGGSKKKEREKAGRGNDIFIS